MPLAHPKPLKRSTMKRKKRQEHADAVRLIRAVVFEREQGICRCCGRRRATSLHEIRPRSLGGVVSLENSIGVCGSGTTGCHGLLQTHRISVEDNSHPDPQPINAQRILAFFPEDDRARAWVHGATMLISPPRFP